MSATTSMRSAWWWIVVTFLMFWVGLLAHETAHQVAARLWLSPADMERPAAFGEVHRAFVSAAGPLTTLTVVLISAVITVRLKSAVRDLSCATALGASSRLVLVGVPTFLARPNDEHVISVVAGMPGSLIWSIEAVATAALIWWMLAESGSRTRTGPATLGIALGWMSAFTFGRAIGLPI